MKVAHINSVYGYGSTGKIVKSIHLECLKEGIDSRAYYGRKENDNDGIFFSNIFNLFEDAFKSIAFDNAGFNSKSKTKKLISYLDEFDPDVIHIHNIHGYYLNIDLLINYINLKNIKVIMTLHDCWTYTGYCVHYDYKNCKKWQTKCYDCDLKNEYPFRLRTRKTTVNFNKKNKLFNSIKDLTIVTPSIRLANDVRKSYLKEYNTIVINNGINLDSFRRKEIISKISNKKIVLGVASVWDKRKGLSEFISIVDGLSEKYIGVIIGLSTRQISELNDKIIGIRRTNNIDELVDLYNSAEILLNTTLEDNFPTVNIEALACGLPILTYNTGGSPEIVGDCGFVVEKHEINKAIKLIENFKKNDDMMDKCVERAHKLYNSKVMNEKYIQLYNSQNL
jgi:glycosyltransferase involved in cell wall biosynthesis